MGSSPIRVAITSNLIPADLAHLVERHLAKVEVAGSSPVIRSNGKRTPKAVSFFSLDGRGILTRQEPPVRFSGSRSVKSHSQKLRLRLLGLFFPCFVDFASQKRYSIVFARSLVIRSGQIYHTCGASISYRGCGLSSLTSNVAFRAFLYRNLPLIRGKQKK